MWITFWLYFYSVTRKKPENLVIVYKIYRKREKRNRAKSSTKLCKPKGKYTKNALRKPRNYVNKKRSKTKQTHLTKRQTHTKWQILNI